MDKGIAVAGDETFDIIDFKLVQFTAAGLFGQRFAFCQFVTFPETFTDFDCLVHFSEEIIPAHGSFVRGDEPFGVKIAQALHQELQLAQADAAAQDKEIVAKAQADAAKAEQDLDAELTKATVSARLDIEKKQAEKAAEALTAPAVVAPPDTPVM